MRACVQQELDARVQSLQYELMDPEDPDSIGQQTRGGGPALDRSPPVVILGFNEASQARARLCALLLSRCCHCNAAAALLMLLR